MSMLSAQIDELRTMAQLEKNLEKPAIARIFGDAADTIWQLRDDLQRANAENTKLRSELESVGVAAYLYGRGDLLAENRKLHALLDYALPIAMYAASMEEGDRIRELMREAVDE